MTTETKLVRFDWALKHLLRDKANFDVLEGFLSAILRNEEISVVEILENETSQLDLDKKFNRVDILVTDSRERHILIEVQNHLETGYLERIFLGICKPIVDNFELGENYRNISKVISISILYFNFGLGEDEDYVYQGTTDFYGLHTHKPFTFQRTRNKIFETLRTKDIFPEFYLIHVEHFKDVVTTELDEWIYLLKHSTTQTDFKAKNIDRAREKLTLSNLAKEERQQYDKYLRDMVVEQDVLETARNEGLQQGELKAKLEIAKKMLAKGMGIETIVTLTSLSPDVIKRGQVD